MKRLLLLALCSGTYCEAFAKDSDWKLCKGEVSLYEGITQVVVNAYEHRNAEGRAADLTFIYGGNILKGSLNTSESTNGNVKLKGAGSTYKGAVSLDYQAQTIHLEGVVTLNKVSSAINATLECETL